MPSRAGFSSGSSFEEGSPYEVIGCLKDSFPLSVGLMIARFLKASRKESKTLK